MLLYVNVKEFVRFKVILIPGAAKVGPKQHFVPPQRRDPWDLYVNSKKLDVVVWFH